MSSSKLLRRNPSRKTSKNTLARDRLGLRLRPLRLECLEPRRLLQGFGNLEPQLQGLQSSMNTGLSSKLSSLPIGGIGPQFLAAIDAAETKVDNAATSIASTAAGLSSGGISAVQNALYAVLGPPGADILGHANDGANAASLPSDINVTGLSFSGGTISATVEMRLHVPVAAATMPLSTLLPTLPIQLVGSIVVSGSIDMELSITFDANGSVTLPLGTAYLNHYSPGLGVGPNGNSQVMFTVDANTISSPVTAYVGFLQGVAVPAGSNQVTAYVYVDSLQSQDTSLGGSAYLNLATTLCIPNQPQMPSVTTIISMSWTNLGDPGTLSLSFQDLTLNLNSFVQETVMDILDYINQYAGPVESVVNVLTTPIPGLNSLDPSCGDLLQIITLLNSTYGNDLQDLVNFVNQIQSLLAAAQTVEQAGSLDFGTFTLGGPGTNLCALPAATTSLSNPASFGGSPPGSLSSLTTGLIPGFNADDFGVSWLAGHASGLGSEAVQAVVEQLANAGAAISFPVFDDPSVTLGMLFGQELDLVKFDITTNIASPTDPLDFPLDIPFSICGVGLSLNFDAKFGASAEIAGGYDTTGLRLAMADPDPSNVGNDLLDGFYLDGPLAGSSYLGTNIQFMASISITAAIGFNLGFCSASIGVCAAFSTEGDNGTDVITVTMNQGLEDNQDAGDNEIHYQNLSGNIGSDIGGSGSITAGLSLVADLSFLWWSAQDTIVNFGSVTLWSFAIANASTEKQPDPVFYGMSLGTSSPGNTSSAVVGPSAGGNTLTIYGANLENATQVVFEPLDGTEVIVPGPFISDTANSIELTVPPDPNGTDNPWTDGAVVCVTTPAPHPCWSGTIVYDSDAEINVLGSGQAYDWQAPPVITSVSPVTGPGPGGSLVEIQGPSESLYDASEVDFGDTPGGDFRPPTGQSILLHLWSGAVSADEPLCLRAGRDGHGGREGDHGRRLGCRPRRLHVRPATRGHRDRSGVRADRGLVWHQPGGRPDRHHRRPKLRLLGRRSAATLDRERSPLRNGNPSGSECAGRHLSGPSHLEHLLPALKQDYQWSEVSCSGALGASGQTSGLPRGHRDGRDGGNDAHRGPGAVEPQPDTGQLVGGNVAGDAPVAARRLHLLFPRVRLESYCR